MSRRIFFQVTAPAVLIGALLVGVCLASLWSIHRLQANLNSILAENVTSLEAAGELEVKLRQLRFHTFMYVLDPTPARRSLIAEDEGGFEAALAVARRSSTRPEEERLVAAIADEYVRYRAGLGESPTPPAPLSREEYLAWADAHPVRPLLERCQELMRVNREAMEGTARESRRLSDRTGTAMVVMAVLAPLGGLVAGFGIARGLRRDALRAEQLAAVGQLAAGVAHEVRNPLVAVKLLIEAALAGGELTTDDLQVIHGEVGRLEQTVRGLLDFARPTPPARAPTDLRAVVGAAVDLVRGRAGLQNVDVRVTVPPVPVTADVDASQVQGVVVNLVLNALDAQPGGGRIDVILQQKPGGGIALNVRDAGPGISPVVLPRLFEPFASTRETGTGLGLNVSRRVARDHGGDLVGTNEPGGGALFTLTLPGGD